MQDSSQESTSKKSINSEISSDSVRASLVSVAHGCRDRGIGIARTRRQGRKMLPRCLITVQFMTAGKFNNMEI